MFVNMIIKIILNHFYLLLVLIMSAIIPMAHISLHLQMSGSLKILHTRSPQVYLPVGMMTLDMSM